MRHIETIQRDLVETILNSFHRLEDKSEDERTQLLSKITKDYEIKLNQFELDEHDLNNKIRLYVTTREAEGLSVKTLEGYECELRMFSKFVNKKTEDVRASDIRDYIGSLEVSRGTQIKKIQTIKAFFGWLLDEEITTSNPAKRVRTPKKEIRVNTYFSVKELETLREACKTPRQRAVLEFYYATGIRLTEGTNIKLEDIDFANLSVNVIGKGNKERTIYFTERALYHLNDYLNSRKGDNEYLFCTNRRPFRKMNDGSMGDEFRKISNQANLGRSISAHDCRRSFATHAISRGVDILVIQHLLGHSDLSVTQRYCELSNERKEFEYRRLMSQ